MHEVQNIELHNESFKWHYATDPTESLNKLFMHDFMVDIKPRLLSFKFLILYLNRNTSQCHNNWQLNWKNSWWNNHLYVCPFEEFYGLNNVYIVFQSNRILLWLFPVLTTVVHWCSCVSTFPRATLKGLWGKRFCFLNAEVVDLNSGC